MVLCIIYGMQDDSVRSHCLMKNDKGEEILAKSFEPTSLPRCFLDGVRCLHVGEFLGKALDPAL